MKYIYRNNIIKKVRHKSNDMSDQKFYISQTVSQQFWSVIVTNWNIYGSWPTGTRLPMQIVANLQTPSFYMIKREFVKDTNPTKANKIVKDHHDGSSTQPEYSKHNVY